MAYAAGDIPEVADVLINGQPYMLYEVSDERGESGYSPLFVPRENVQGDYGDSQFDFWLTFSQNDWSLGSGQRFLRVNDQDSRRQFWQSQFVNVDNPGEVVLSRLAQTNTAAQGIESTASSVTDIFFAGSTTGYKVTGTSATESSIGTHGIGGAPSEFGMVDDGINLYASNTTDSGTAIRKHSAPSTWAQFSAQEVDSLEYLNNTLYGFAQSTGTLYSFDTSGTATAIHAFTSADATATQVKGTLKAFGANLLVMITPGLHEPPGGRHTSIYEYDGVGITKISDLPNGFEAWSIESFEGSAFIGGHFRKLGDAGTAGATRPAVFVLAGGQLTQIWENDTENEGVVMQPYLIGWDRKLWWQARDNDLNANMVFSYNPRTGAIVAETSAVTSSPQRGLAATNQHMMLTAAQAQTSYELFPDPDGGYETTGFIKTSLFDGDSTLQKHWESVQVEFDSASDGDGGSVDISRAFDSLTDSDFSSVQTGATSGTEYKIDAASREISLKITLNKGTSTSGPVLKAVRLRGAPINPSFRRERYVLNLHGVDGEQHVMLRNGQVHPLDGLAQATNLRTAFTSGDDFSVTDEFGTYNAVFEPNGLRLIRTRSQEYVAIVELRES